MYDLINRHAVEIVNAIPRDHVTDYEWLFDNLTKAKSPDFQREFRLYWAMNAAQLGTDFYDLYFDLLAAPHESMPSLDQICCKLYECSTRRNGAKSLQFSFATKLFHMRNQRSPIYDSQLAAFYYFERPSSEGTLERRVSEFIKFHEFLRREYKRVLDDGILSGAIREFRTKLCPSNFTDEKVIDSLIWKTADLLSKGALVNGQMSYR